jgi:UDP-glucose 4-epimerase
MAGVRVLVTGGAGFIGRSVVPALTDAGAEVRVVDREPYPDPGVAAVVGDLRDPGIRDAVLTPDLTGVVHLAAATSVLGSLADRPRCTGSTSRLPPVCSNWPGCAGCAGS